MVKRDKSISGVERNDILKENFENLLMKNLSKSIGGFFWKRKSHYFKNEKPKSSFFHGFLKKIGSSVIYDKRYFHIDLQSSTLAYAKDPEAAKKNPIYKVMLRDIQSVNKYVVSMPVTDSKGEVNFIQKSIFEIDADVDRGPSGNCQNVFELKVSNRLFTLYTDDNNLME
jgi:hypothetical protein